MSLELRFLGGAGTVTGSRFLLTTGDTRILVDCGLFQGLKELRLRNREPFPVAPAEIDAVLLTHAHLDHSGYLPVLVRDGFRGPIYCTAGTARLCDLLLPDSGHLQEEEADYANRHGFSKHSPALPLYTREDAARSLDSLMPVAFGTPVGLPGGATAVFHPAGHIIGAAMITVEIEGRTILFSGDLGRRDDPILPPPAVVREADYVVVESTYGGRAHDAEDALGFLERVIRRTAARGGTLLIPAFAVGRTQTLLYLIHRLKQAERIPGLPVFLDSPMAQKATRVFVEHSDDHRLTAEQSRAVANVARPTESVQESKMLDQLRHPAIIISASGMATGGRVVHHLKVLAPEPRNTILLPGFQARGTRGASLRDGARSIRIHGQDVAVRAEVVTMEGLSAHADQPEILDWLHHMERAPERLFLVHGEPESAQALATAVREGFGWTCVIPEHGEVAPLEPRIPHGRPGRARGIRLAP